MWLKKIVVAEDDDAIAHLVNMALGDAGFLCVRARDGEEALHLARLHVPDLVVLDVMMPGADGYEVARRLKADTILSRIPILMLTAKVDVDSKVDGFDAGADDYVTKPFDLREFNARVKALIRTVNRERDRNPTTNLPGSASVEEQIKKAMAADGDLAVAQLDVANYDRFASQVGFAESGRLVEALGRTILNSASQSGVEFVGHLGGTDFVVVGSGPQVRSTVDDAVDRCQQVFGDHQPEGTDMRLVAGIVPTHDLSEEKTLTSRLVDVVRRAREDDGHTVVVWEP